MYEKVYVCACVGLVRTYYGIDKIFLTKHKEENK
jgi:hypothetical protein